MPSGSPDHPSLLLSGASSGAAPGMGTTILRVLTGGAKPERHRRRSGQRQQWVCPVCRERLQVATSVAVWVILCPETDGRRVTGGTKSLICAYCLANGTITRIT